AFNRKAVADFCHASATNLWFNQCGKTNLAFDTFVGTALPFDTQARVFHMQLMCLRAVKTQTGGDVAGAIGGQTNHHHLISKRREHLPRKCYATMLIAHLRYGVCDVEIAIKIGEAFMPRKIQREIAE